jgi:hypothetical protein
MKKILFFITIALTILPALCFAENKFQAEDAQFDLNTASNTTPLPTPTLTTQGFFVCSIEGGDYDKPQSGVKVDITRKYDFSDIIDTCTTDEDGCCDFDADELTEDFAVIASKNGYFTTLSLYNIDDLYNTIGMYTGMSVIDIPTDFTGKFKGVFSSSLMPKNRVTFNLKRKKNKIFGTIKSKKGLTGNITGTVKGNLIKFKIKQTTKSCKGTFSGIGIGDVLAVKLHFTFKGSNCKGTHNDGYGYLEY